MSKRNLKYIAGLSLIEILIGIIITSIMMAAMYTSYTVVNQSYSQVSEKAKISRSSRDLVSMIMRDIRMSGFRYYAGSFEINKYGDDTTADCTAPGMTLPKLSYLVFQDGFDQGSGVQYTDDENHNPIVIRKNTLGPNRTSETRGVSEVTNDTDLCCDQIQIVYEDFNQNDILQPYKKYRITYFGSQTGTDEVVTPNGIKNINRYGVYKLIQSWSQVRTSSTDCDFPITGSWVTNCPECTSEPVLVRDHIEDMEFIALDQNGVMVEAQPSNMEKIMSIRSVDLKLTFRSSTQKGYFKNKINRVVKSFTNERTKQIDSKFHRDTIFLTVHTRNIGGGDI